MQKDIAFRTDPATPEEIVAHRMALEKMWKNKSCHRCGVTFLCPSPKTVCTADHCDVRKRTPKNHFVTEGKYMNDFLATRLIHNIKRSHVLYFICFCWLFGHKWKDIGTFLPHCCNKEELDVYPQGYSSKKCTLCNEYVEYAPIVRYRK